MLAKAFQTKAVCDGVLCGSRVQILLPQLTVPKRKTDIGMTNPTNILDHLNPSEITPSGWVNAFGLLAWCAVGAFFLSKTVSGLGLSLLVGAVAFVVLAYALAFVIHKSNE